MIRCILLCVLFLPLSFTHAQSPLLDSLKMEIEKREANGQIDSTYINLRNDYVLNMIYSAPSDTSLLTFQMETVQISRNIDFLKGTVMGLQRLGVIHQYLLNDPDRAIDYYQEAIVLIEQDPLLEEHLYTSKSNMATIYLNQKEFEKALAIYRELYPKYRQATIMEANMANAFGELQQYDSAIYYFREAVRRAEPMANQQIKQIEIISYSGLSLMYLKKNHYDSALNAISTGLELLEKYPSDLVKPAVFMNASMVYLGSKDYTKAETYAKETISLTHERNWEVREAAYGTLTEVYMYSNQGKKGYEALQTYLALRDSIRNNDRRLAISRKELEFEAEREKAQAKMEVDRISFQNKLTTTASVATLMVGLLGFMVFRGRVQKKNAEQQAQVAESELKKLRAQLNPHFLYNVLNSISEYMVAQGPEAASDYLAEYSGFIRKVFAQSEQGWVTLEKELELMEDFVKIGVRWKSLPITLGKDIDPQLAPESVLVPSLFIQPFIENSIEHGFPHGMTEPGEIKLAFFPENDQSLVCIVEDNGQGFNEKSNLNGHSGAGIARKRIEVLNQLTGGNVFFTLENLDKGARVTLKIPLKHQF